MMIALPNRDKSWTVTLFMPLKNFQELKKPETLLKFFQINFPDALNYMTEDGLIRDYFSTVPSHLVSIKVNFLFSFYRTGNEEKYIIIIIIIRFSVIRII